VTPRSQYLSFGDCSLLNDELNKEQGTRTENRERGRNLRSQRGVTLIEVLVALSIAAMLAGVAFIGMGGLSSARLRESSTLIVGAVRAAYSHANATSRPTRIVFDFEAETIALEDSVGRMFVQNGDRTGGAAAATDLEQEAVAESEAILEGPRAPRPTFQPVKKILGFEHDDSKGVAMKQLATGIHFRQIEVAHEDEEATTDRVYLYFWPGGQTERASIQIQKGEETDAEDHEIITVLVSPLTGKTAVVGGPVEMPRPRTDEEASERQDVD
jgi:general secretion pathway protein H